MGHANAYAHPAAVWIESHVGKAPDVNIDKFFFHLPEQEPQKNERN